MYCTPGGDYTWSSSNVNIRADLTWTALLLLFMDKVALKNGLMQIIARIQTKLSIHQSVCSKGSSNQFGSGGLAGLSRDGVKS